MLRALRSGGVTQVLMGGVVFAIIAVFVVQFRAGSGEQTGALQQQCAAQVVGHCVTVKDFYASYGLVVPRGMPPKHVKALGLRRQVLDGLVERELLIRAAEDLGLSVTEEAIDDELTLGRGHVSLPASDALRLGYTLDLTNGDQYGFSREMVRELPVRSAKTQKFDYEIYKRVIQTTARRSPKEFKEMQRREIVAARMRDLVRTRARISEQEAFATFRRERAKAVIRFVRIEREWFSRYAVDVTDEAIDAWAAKNAEAVDAAWKQDAAAFKAGCTLISEIVTPFEGDTTDDDKVLLRDSLDQAKKRLDEGAEFSEVSRQVGGGPTASMGGFLGCFDAKGYGDGGEAIAAALKDRSKGDVTDLVETTRGFHLVRFDGVLAEGDVETLGRRATARRLAVAAQTGELAQQFGEALIKSTSMGAKLEDAALDLTKEFSIAIDQNAEPTEGDDEEAAEPPPLSDARRPKVEISGSFTANSNPVSGMLPGYSAGQVAFALEKADDVHPELLPTITGFAVVQLKEKVDVTREEFDKDRSLIVRQLLLAKQSDALSKYVERLRATHEAKIELNARLVDDPSPDDDDSTG